MSAQNFEQELADWALAGCPVPAPAELKRRVVANIVKESGLNIFVESGTYLGDTTKAIADMPDLHVHTIELSDQLYRDAVSRFQSMPNVQCWQGDGLDVVPEILKTLPGPAVFWLDGHFSAGITARGRKICPTFEELFFILVKPNPGHVILIDDMRCFSGGEYPKASLLKETIHYFWPSYTVDISLDIMRILPPGFGAPFT